MTTDEEITSEVTIVTTAEGNADKMPALDAARFAGVLLAKDDGSRPGTMALARVVIRLAMSIEDYETLVDFLAMDSNHHFNGAACRAIARALKAQRPQ